MTAATLHLVAPTRLERGLQGIAASLSSYVDSRIAARAERREIALDLLREQHARRHDPRALDIALLSIGSRPRP
ncbi:hypothetical protein [Microbacterium sp. H1-D42]|uniref:hypothetical protein n=1 Tax=Microbacterium sp. H1-D42 TaxID=2925844 RepID=UPI001F52C88F|nr:hypothetical protein [Microbacterium sp. H1-D42]UNK72196.1 hypothetical protein MNR00_07070 [Microbacterium sp. H1-D42]